MTPRNLLLAFSFLVFPLCLISTAKFFNKEHPKESLKISNITYPSPLDLCSINENPKPDKEGDYQDTDWYSKAMGQVSKDEYNITFNEELNSYQSPNRNNNIRFIYNKNGFTAKTRQNKIPLFDINNKNIKNKDKTYKKIPEWSIKINLNGYSKDITNTYQTSHSINFVPFNGNEIQINENKAFIEDENMKINYTNDKIGMRQDFIVKNKPFGNGKLKLDLNVSTTLKMDVGDRVVSFRDGKGLEIMEYSSLKVWDSNYKELNSYFEPKNKEPNKNQFSIVVDDENAVYPITIDPLSATSNWLVESNQLGAQIGFSIATAGDVNGDGFSDVIVGANKYDNGHTDEGKAFVYYGSSNGLSNSANWSSEPNQANAEFGFCVSTAGDVNGDGFSDVIIGANKYDSGQTDEGKVFAYYGSATGLSLTHNWSAESNQASALFGNSVSTAGDVNGDGYSDVIIGSHLFDNGQSNEGRAFVFHGSSTGLSAIANWTAEINQANAFFGYSVSTAFDVNGDGYSDVIIGAYLFDNGQTDEGKAFVYLGSSTGLLISSIWSVESDQSFANYGYSVAGSGDVNGDGYSDIIVGANNFDNGEIDEGKAFVYLGSSSGITLSPIWTMESDQASANFGNRVSTAGDVNGDGFSDVIVGSYLFDNGQSDEGRVFFYFGEAWGLSYALSWSTEGNQVSAAFGSSIATAGDVNGDGFSDVIIGSYLYDNGQSDEGSVFAYYGSAENLYSYRMIWETNQSNANFGWSVSGAGDVNGDGYSDVIIGAPYYDNGQSDEGSAFVYTGSISGFEYSWTAESDQSSSNFGYSVSTAGDVNGDGFSDVIVGARYYDNGETNEGRAYVYFGSATGLSAVSNWTNESNQANSNFGWSVSAAGDVNGDGYSDVIIGAPYFDNDQTDEGIALVYLGSATGLSTTAAWFGESNQASSNFGYSVSTAGDVNGDVYTDIIVGARYYDNGQSNEGRSYLYLGSSSGLSTTEAWTAEPNLTSSYFGTSVSTAGDVNGDGYCDVIVGAPYLNNGQTDEGRAYVYLGTAVGLSATSHWTAESNQAGALFGISVSSSGDVNGDGYSDVIVGAQDYDNGETNEGGVFLYLGSSSGLSTTAYWSLEANVSSARFGNSVSSAGDVNGDGFSDFIIGAKYYNNGQYDEGMAYFCYKYPAGGKTVLQQFNPVNNKVISAGGLTGKDAQSRVGIFARSSYGRSQGKMVYEYKSNGLPFSGNPITNSVSGTPSGSFTDLLLSGKNLTVDLNGLSQTKEYKWRARIQYKLSSNPYQKYGPWKYYNNYITVPYSGFKPRQNPQINKTLNLTVLIEGLYNSVTNSMIQDTARVYLRNSSTPFAVVDSAKFFLSTAGVGTFIFFSPPLNLTPYYIQIKHRNSIETWSSTNPAFVNSMLSYNFSDVVTKAYGNNMKQVDSSPIRFAIFSGDVNQDGVIDATDAARIDNDASIFLTGYVISDLTGDGFVDATDASVTDNNALNFVSKITP